MILVDRQPEALREKCPGLVGPEGQRLPVEQEGLALDEQTRQAPKRRTSARRDDQVQTLRGTGEQLLHQSVRRCAIVEHVEVVEDQDGLALQLVNSAQHRRRQDVQAGPGSQDLEGGLANAGGDLPQGQHDAGTEEIGIRVGLVEREPGNGSVEMGEAGHKQVGLAIAGFGGHDDQPSFDALPKTVHQPGAIDHGPSQADRRQLGRRQDERTRPSLTSSAGIVSSRDCSGASSVEADAALLEP